MLLTSAAVAFVCAAFLAAHNYKQLQAEREYADEKIRVLDTAARRARSAREEIAWIAAIEAAHAREADLERLRAFEVMGRRARRLARYDEACVNIRRASLRFQAERGWLEMAAGQN